MKLVFSLVVFLSSSLALAALKPTARIDVGPATGYLPMLVSMSGAGSTSPNGQIVSYAWSFGDGTTGTGVTTSHYYSTKRVETIRLTVTDSAGEKATAVYTYQFTIDKTPPELSFDVPPQFVVQTDTPIISAFYSDATSKVNLAKVRMILDDVDVSNRAVISDTHAVLEFTTAWPLSPGAHNLIVSVSDYYGNTTSKKIAFSYKASVITKNFLNGKVVDNDGLPVAGVEVLSVSGPTKTLLSGTTDSNGEYSLPFTVGGEYVLRFAKSGYLENLKTKTLIAGQDDALEKVFMALGDTKTTFVTSSSGGTVTNTDDSISIVIPPGALATDASISITEAKTGKTLAVPLPNGSQFTFAQTLQPMGLSFNVPVEMSLSNVLGLPPGFEIPVGLANQALGIWADSGFRARVSEDGTKILFLFTNSAAVFSNGSNRVEELGPGDVNLNSLPEDPDNNEHPDPDTDPNGDCNCGQGLEITSRIFVNSNNLLIDYELPAVTRRGKKYNLKFSYSSLAAHPHTMLTAHTSYLDGVTSPTNLLKKISWIGKLEEKTYTGESAVKQSTSYSGFRPVNVEGKNLPKGSFPYRVELASRYDNMVYAETPYFGGPALAPTNVRTREPVHLPEAIYGREIIYNEKESSFGVGWSLAGLERLVQDSDGAVSFFNGDGIARYYFPLGVTEGQLVTQKNVSGETSDLIYHKGQIYGADCASNQVFRLDGAGRITTLAGGQRDKITNLQCPKNIYPSRKGGFYVSDSGNGRIVYVGTDRAVRVLADRSKGAESPSYVAEDNVLALHFIDGKEIKTISPYDGSVFTLIGESEDAVYKFKLKEPKQILFDEYHNLIVTDSGLGQVIKFYIIGARSRVIFKGIEGVNKLAFDPVLKRYFALDKKGNVHHWQGQGYKKVHALDFDSGLPKLYFSSQKRSGTKVSAIAYSPELGLVYSTQSGIVMKAKDNLSKRSTDVSYVPSISDFSELVKHSDGTFTRTLVDKTVIEYDAAGYMVSKVLPGGETMNYVYGANHKLLQVHVPSEGFYQFNYDGRGYLSSVVDPGGRATTFQIDGSGDLTVVTNPEGGNWNYSYNSDHLLTKKRDEMGLETEYQFSLSRPTGVIKPGGRFKSIRHPGIHQLITENTATEIPRIRPTDVATKFVSPEGRITHYVLNNQGIHEAVVDGEGGKTFFERNVDSLPTTTSSSEGRKTYRNYDDRGRVTTMQDGEGSRSLAYDPVSQKVGSMTDGFNNTESYQYNAQGSVTKFTNRRGNETNFTFNADGTIKSVLDSYNHETSFERDTAGNVIATVDPLGNRTSMERDLSGNMISMTDPLGFKTFFDVDGLNRTTKVTDAKNGQTHLSYLPTGEIESITDARGNKTTFAYNEQKKIVSVLNQLGQEEMLSYDQDGNLVTKTTKRGDQFTFTYNRNNKLTGKLFPNDSVSFTFDGDNLLTKASDSDSWVAREYDVFKRLSSETVSHAPAKVVYVYDQRGSVSNVKLFLQNRSVMDLRRWYQQTGKVFKVTGHVAGEDFEFTQNQDANDKFSGLNLPNGASFYRVFDKNARVIEQVTTINSGLGHSLRYRYNGNGNITFIQDEFNGQRKINRFKYDELNRIVEEDTLEKRTYSLDALGNDLSSGAQYNELNHLLENAEFVFEYDLNGNRAKKTSKLTGERIEYRHSAENRLEEVKLFKAGNVLAKTISHSYDALGRRIIRSVQDHLAPSKSYTKKFIYEGENVLAVLDGEDNFVAGYVHGEGIDDPVIMVTDTNGDGEMEVLSFIKDHQNSVKFILDDAGNVLQEIDYSAYGETKITNRGHSSIEIANNFYYTSRELELETGEYFYRARFYDPYSQKFLSEDPIGFIGGDTNLYRYIQNNPLSDTDPSGQITLGAVLALAGTPLAINSVLQVYGLTNQILGFESLIANENLKIQGYQASLATACSADEKARLQRQINISNGVIKEANNQIFSARMARQSILANSALASILDPLLSLIVSIGGSI